MEKTTNVAVIATAPVKVEPTSPKLVELQAQRKAKNLEARASEPESEEEHKLQLEVWAIDNLIKAEKVAIAKAEKDAELALKRNERTKIADDFEAAIRAECEHYYLTFLKSKKTPADNDALNTFTDVTKATRDNNKNELLSRYATSTPSKSVATGQTKPAGTKGATSLAIREAFIANRATGMTDTENAKAIIASGFSRGTTGAVILAYQREIGEKA